MSSREVILSLVTVGSLGCTLSLPNGGEVANGISGQLSFDLEGAVAAGSPFKIKVWAPTPNRRCYGLLGCSDRAPMTSATITCADGQVCQQTDKEPSESEDFECTFIMRAGQPGTTEVQMEVLTADGEVRRDTLQVNVVSATEVQLDCGTCGEEGELSSGSEHRVTCVPYNLDVQSGALRGDCEVRADGLGIQVQPSGADADFYLDTERGTAANDFSVRVSESRSGTVVFRSGAVERRLSTPAAAYLR
jgi:hypothetical protein